MNWFFYAPVGILVFVGVALIPRLRLIADYGPKRKIFIVRWLWMDYRCDIRRRVISGRLLFLRFSKRFEKRRGAGLQVQVKEAVKERRTGIAGDFWRERRLVFLLVKRLPRLIVRLLRCTRTDRLDLKLDIATSDPALTGMLSGIGYCALSYLPEVALWEITPVFEGGSSKLDLNLSISVSPLPVIFILLTETFQLPWRRLIKARRTLRLSRANY